MARFGEPEQAQHAVKDVDAEGRRMVAGYQAVVRVLTGDEEREYMEKVARQRAETKAQGAAGGGRGGRGRGGRGGRGRGRGRGRH